MLGKIHDTPADETTISMSATSNLLIVGGQWPSGDVVTAQGAVAFTYDAYPPIRACILFEYQIGGTNTKLVEKYQKPREKTKFG